MVSENGKEIFAYEPGVCNIDSTGVRWRKRLGYISLVIGMVSMGLMYDVHIGQIYRFILGAGFGFVSALNLLQASEHFCVTNATKRTYEISLKRSKITNDLYKEQDMRKSRKMIWRSLIYTLLAGCLGLLPF
jgi:hypothetical protein